MTFLLGIIPALLIAILTGWIGTSSGQVALEKAALEKIVSIRSAKKSEIEGYFKTIKNQVQTYSNNRMIINAMLEFKTAFLNYRAENMISDSSQFKTSLSQYYHNEFLAEYKRRNNEVINADFMMNSLDADSLALQYQYISANKHPLGNKDALVDAGDLSEYSRLHKTYHPHIHNYLNQFGFYDIFLVDSETGDIVYSVFKELDFSTSLINGPYANLGIGQAFKKANSLSNESDVALTDFASYTPSYEDQAAFIASPRVLDNKKLGILIFQMPINRINTIMTYNQEWKSSGLGESGETYLVGQDNKMRSLG